MRSAVVRKASATVGENRSHVRISPSNTCQLHVEWFGLLILLFILNWLILNVVTCSRSFKPTLVTLKTVLEARLAVASANGNAAANPRRMTRFFRSKWLTIGFNDAQFISLAPVAVSHLLPHLDVGPRSHACGAISSHRCGTAYHIFCETAE